MARAQQTDFLQVFRFHVRAVGPDGASRLVPAGRPDAGFSAVGTPRLSIEAVPYKEGTMNYAVKQPGPGSFEDITMSRGIARGDSTFWDWAKQTAEGGGEYRADLDVLVFHRVQALPSSTDTRNTTRINLDNPACIIHIFNAFPTGVPLFGELDATSAEIAVQELSVALEYATREDVRQT